MNKWITATALSVALSACIFGTESKSTPSTPSSDNKWVQFAETTSTSGYSLHFYAQTDSLGTGYRPIQVCLHNHEHPELPIRGQRLEFLPWMTMMSKSHASPVENPSSTTDSNGCASGAVVFTMPSNSKEGWTLGVRFGQDSARIPLWIKTQDKVLMSADPADSSKRVLIAWVGPQTLKVGSQKVELAVFSKNSLGIFSADSSWTFNQFEPTMPSMGHGSPGNILPTLNQGHYHGILNFTMSGDWNIAVGLRRGDLGLNQMSWDKTVVE